MTMKYLNILSPTTLSGLAADLEGYLLKQFDEDEINTPPISDEWDKMSGDMTRAVNALMSLVGTKEANFMLSDARTLRCRSPLKIDIQHKGDEG